MKVKYLTKGRVACSGGVSDIEGIARLMYVDKHESNEDFQKGEILVAPMTDIDLEEMMMDASAIITDKGGETSHAAVTAREYNIPCITSTENITQVARSGGRLYLDLTNGEIYSAK
jgi:rifampicin phosphotransferase